MGQRYGILASMVVFYGRKVAACWNCCIHFAVLLHIYCSVTAKLLQYYCKYMSVLLQTVLAPLQKACECLYIKGSVASIIEWGDSAICHSPRRWHTFPSCSPLYPRPSVDCALKQALFLSICGKSLGTNRFIIRPHTCSNSLEGMSILPSQLYVHQHSSRCRLRRPFLPRRISTCRRRLTVNSLLTTVSFVCPRRDGRRNEGVKEKYNWSLLVDCFLQTLLIF